MACKENPTIAMYDVYFIVQLIYGAPSIYLWIRIIKAIIIDRSHASFAHPFHRVLAATGIISVIVFINDMIFTRFLLTGRFCTAISSAFSSLTYWLSPTVFIAMYGIGCQLTGSVLLSLNRLTAVFTIRHTEIWSRYIVIAYIFLFTPSLITSWYLIPALTYVKVDATGTGMSIVYVKLFPWISTTLFSLVICAISGLLILIFTGITMLCFKRMRKMTINSSRFERTLFILGLYQSGSTLIMCIYQLSMYLLIQAGLTAKLSYLFSVRSFFWDILTLLPAWATFFTNDPIRKTLGCGTAPRKSTTASIHLPVSQRVSSMSNL
ncbi:hypothetical protein PMAYCL1PPCAC_00747 [Pristionchus mayeri]|uniref:Serpentine receptor class gamma n=1 Tax=Pristionchus mayeri TaxID=1317129 RepID=A0AAN4Z372_9BILA|nr:hypothetical protein PMAYCL1PPCAC_00745 [Pristionchus mayeri]GMR30552.1 hypothetical protein PMAYCL1PPCAC_00747 [Pristionchus mayeri]